MESLFSRTTVQFIAAYETLNFRMAAEKCLVTQPAITKSIKKIESGSRSGNIQFSQSTNVDPECIISLVQKCPKLYKLVDAHRLSFSFSSDDPDSQLKFVSDILEKLKLNN